MKEELEDKFPHIVSDSENDIDGYLEIENRYDNSAFYNSYDYKNIISHYINK